MVQDLMKTREDWDFIYFGRKRNKGNPEFFVSGLFYYFNFFNFLSSL